MKESGEGEERRRGGLRRRREREGERSDDVGRAREKELRKGTAVESGLVEAGQRERETIASSAGVGQIGVSIVGVIWKVV